MGRINTFIDINKIKLKFERVMGLEFSNRGCRQKI